MPDQPNDSREDDRKGQKGMGLRTISVSDYRADQGVLDAALFGPDGKPKTGNQLEQLLKKLSS